MRGEVRRVWRKTREEALLRNSRRRRRKRRARRQRLEVSASSAEAAQCRRNRRAERRISSCISLARSTRGDGTTFRHRILRATMQLSDQRWIAVCRNGDREASSRCDCTRRWEIAPRRRARRAASRAEPKLRRWILRVASFFEVQGQTNTVARTAEGAQG
jgi:hypothetical protein